jgi:hypothetical protein
MLREMRLEKRRRFRQSLEMYSKLNSDDNISGRGSRIVKAKKEKCERKDLDHLEEWESK